MGKRGWTLLELMVVVMVVVGSAAVAAPLMGTYLAQLRWRAFRAEIVGHLMLAREVAARLEASMHFAVSPEPNGYQITYELAGETRALVGFTPFPKNVELGLPVFNLPHPSRAGVIERAMSSTHAPSVIFASKGSSSATLVFSDDESHVLCVVLASQHGRLRFYEWRSGHWEAL